MSPAVLFLSDFLLFRVHSNHAVFCWRKERISTHKRRDVEVGTALRLEGGLSQHVPNTGATALLLAAERAHHRVVRMLLRRNADTNLTG